MFQLKRKIKSFVFWIMIKLKIYYNESVSKKYQSFEFISVKKYFLYVWKIHIFSMNC